MQARVDGAVSAISMGELAAGPHATPDAEERAVDKIVFNERRRLSIHCRSTARPSRAYGRAVQRGGPWQLAAAMVGTTGWAHLRLSPTIMTMIPETKPAAASVTAAPLIVSACV